MAEYNISDITKMQHNAAARVAEMQRRSDELIAQNAARHGAPLKPPLPKPPPLKPHHEEPKSGGFFDLKSILPFDLSSFGGDRALILLMLFLLRGEHSDRLLMLALVYLAL